jgi:hypothetical protein
MNKIQWNPNGKYFTVSDGKNLIIGSPDISEDQNEEYENENEGNLQSFTGNNSNQMFQEESYNESAQHARSFSNKDGEN